MEVAWRTFTAQDGCSYRRIEISRDSDWQVFEDVAHALEVALDGRWTTRLDGPDQRYWDLVAHSGRLTLHLEHYLGITLFSTAEEAAEPESVALLERAYGVLSKYEPA